MSWRVALRSSEAVLLSTRSVSRVSAARFTLYLAVASALVACGCGDSSAPSKAVFGQVTCNGAHVQQGSIRFVPIRDSRGIPKTAYIGEGQYRIDESGGVPLGWYRVEVIAEGKTGRKVPDRGLGGLSVDQWVPISDDRYAREQSPLEIEVSDSSDGRFDFDVPRRSK